MYFLTPGIKLSSCSHASTKRNFTLGSSLYLFTAICIPGNEALHGPHQVAQKSTITTLPLRSFNETVFPSRSFSLNSGAGLLIMVLANSARSLFFDVFSSEARYCW